MSKLHISVRFLAGQFHGEEWPPAPARLIQALICAGRQGASGQTWGDAELAALHWLEGLPAPHIHTAIPSQGEPYDLFVPDNESDVAAKEALAGRRFDLSRFRTRKPVRPKLTPGPREEPDVVYSWSADPAKLAEHAPAISALADKLCSLGWGIDMACAEATVASAPPATLPRTYVPATIGRGRPLRVPAAGFSKDVLESWQGFRSRISSHGVNPYTKPDSYAVQRYREVGDLPWRAIAAFRLETVDGDGFAWPWEEAPVVAAWLRHATAEALREEDPHDPRIAAEVLGHAEDTGSGPRLSYVPLPTVGHRFSDASIRRVLVAESLDMDGSLIRLLAEKLPTRLLTEVATGKPRARLVAPPADDKVLPSYTSESATWTTVTPVVLHGYNTAHGKLSQTKTERLLMQAFSNSGYPDTLIHELAFRPACSWPGPGAATSIWVPQHLAHWPRYHVYVRFSRPVAGPILAGIGRHYGLGLFAAGNGRKE